MRLDLERSRRFFSKVLNTEGIRRKTTLGTEVEIDGVVYAAREVDRLRRLSPEKVRAVHKVKKILGGEILR